MDIAAGGSVLSVLRFPRHVSRHARADRLDEPDHPPGPHAAEEYRRGMLFDMLRRYVESRLETPIKAGRLLP